MTQVVLHYAHTFEISYVSLSYNRSAVLKTVSFKAVAKKQDRVFSKQSCCS